MSRPPTEVERAIVHVLTARLTIEALITTASGDLLALLSVAVVEILDAERLLRRRQKRSQAQQAARDLLAARRRDDGGISTWE